MQTIELMAFTFDKETLSDKKVFGFKINETFKNILGEIHQAAGRRYAGRKIFQIANALQQTEVVHCHGDLYTISKNNDIWFYSDNEFNPQLLFTFITKWMKEELNKYELEFEIDNSIEFFGEFIEMSWAELLDKTKYLNGKKTLEKLSLSLLEDKVFDFLDGDASTLTLHRVIHDSESMLMSQPLFPKRSSAYSYTLKTQIEEVKKDELYQISFLPSVRLWIQESPLARSNYFKTGESTNAYITTPGLLKASKKVVFNQISLRKNSSGIYSPKIAHESFLKTTGTDIQDLLKKELMFDPQEINLMVTLPNDCRGDIQKVSKKKLSSTAYGIGLPEREKIFYFVKEELIKHGFGEIPPFEPESKGLSFVKTTSFDKISTFEEYGVLDYVDTEGIKQELDAKIEAWIKDGMKKKKPTGGNVELNEEPFVSFEGKETFKIAVFSPNAIMQRILIATTRMLVHAKEQVRDFTYRNENGLTIEFLVFEENITNEITKTSEVNERMRLIKSIIGVQPIDGAFIEIGDLKGSKGDPKKHLRTMFSSFGIKTQFIHPAIRESEKVSLLDVKGEITNRSMASSHDLLSKLGFVDIKTKRYFEENNSYTAVSRIRFFNQLFVPVIIKNCVNGAKIKIYPESEWMNFADLEARINKRYIQQNEEDWSKVAYFERSILHLNWLNKELAQIKQEDDKTRVIWDVRLDSLFVHRDDDFKDFIDNRLNGLDLTFIRYEYTKKYMGYLMRNGKGKLGKYKGIFKPDFCDNKWFLIGSRVNTAQAPVAATKWGNPTKQLIAPSLCEASIYSEKEVNHFNEILDLQYLRKANITFDVESAYPYPLSLTRYVEELVDAFYACHSIQAQEKKK